MQQKNCSTLFWDFSLKVYSTEQVPAACIELQDTIGLDVNVLLLTLLATAVKRRALDRNELEGANDFIAHWRNDVVRPIRAIRRRLKAGVHPVPIDVSEPLRNEIKEIELRSEYIEQQVLAAWLDEIPASSDSKFDINKELSIAARAVVDIYKEQLLGPDAIDCQNLYQLADLVATVSSRAVLLLNVHKENQ